jgi:hypothetical protein
MSRLILKRASASRPSGQWRDDDFDVIENRVVIGRIFLSPGAPAIFRPAARNRAPLVRLAGAPARTEVRQVRGTHGQLGSTTKLIVILYGALQAIALD